MTASLEALLHEALINNTFSLSSVEKCLRYSLDNSFSYLYRLQRSLIGYEEFHFNTKKDTSEKNFGDMYLDKYGRVCINFDYDLVDMNARDKFRNSKFFMKEFTQKDIQDNQNLFSRSLLLMIDNQILFDFKIRMDNGTTTIILPFKSKYLLTNEGDYVNHDVCIMVIPNVFFTQYITNKGMLAIQSPDQSSTHYIKKSSISLKRPESPGLYFAFIQKEEDLFASSFQEVEILENGDFHILCNDYADSIISGSSGNLIITLVFFKDLYKHVMYDGNPITVKPVGLNDIESNLFVIQRDEMVPFAMPIPTENLLIMKQIRGNSELTGEWVPFVESEATLYYPNIYQIKDASMKNGDIYQVYYFYQKNYVLQYTPRFNFYYKYLSRRLDMNFEQALNCMYFGEVKDISSEDKDAFFGTFKKLLGYEWYDHKYDLIDYVNDNSDTQEPTEYKVNRLKEFIADDPECLHHYVLEQNKISDCFYLYVKDIDLSLRYRTDTTHETDRKIYFGDNDPRYLFVFQNPDPSKEFQCRIYIDGELSMNHTHISYKLMEYFYIPVDRIHEDSYIEVEVFHSCVFGQEIYFPDEETPAVITMNGSLEINPTLQDICLIDSENGKEYDISKFRIYKMEENGFESIVFNDDKSMKVDFSSARSIKIFADDESVLHRHINFNIWKSPYHIQVDMTRNGYPCIFLDGYKFKFDQEYIQIFYNGRLIPKRLCSFKDSFGSSRVQILFEMKKGERISIDISPYRNRLVYFIEQIENFSSDPFLIDLTGKINKPFDPKYYDVFSNGRKLSENNIHLITPTKIALTNMTSSYYLEIYEKDRDWEYFGLDYNSHRFYFSPDDLIDEGYVSSMEGKEIIDDIIETTKDPSAVIKGSTDDEESIDISIEPDRMRRIKVFYYEELLPKELVNPDIVQFNKQYLQEEYPEIVETYLHDSNGTGDYSNTNNLKDCDVLMLNPDVTMKGDENGDTMVFLVGDYDSIMKE